MPESDPPRGITLDTLGKLADWHEGITAHCYETDCRASYSLDMATLIWTRGRDFPSDRIASRLRCPKCGSRNIGIRVSPWTGPASERPGPWPMTNVERAAMQRKGQPGA